MSSRRDALRFLLAGSAAAALPSAALAFRIVEETDTPRVRALVEACEARSAHERLIAEVLADLGETEGSGPAIETLRGMTCPVCGCGLAQALPDADAAPRF